MELEPPNFSREDCKKYELSGMVGNFCFKGKTYEFFNRHATIEGEGHWRCAKCYVYNEGDAPICCVLGAPDCVVGGIMDTAALKQREALIDEYKRLKAAGVPWSAPKAPRRDVCTQETAYAMEIYLYASILRTPVAERKSTDPVWLLAPYVPEVPAQEYPRLIPLNADRTHKTDEELEKYMNPRRKRKAPAPVVKTETEERVVVQIQLAPQFQDPVDDDEEEEEESDDEMDVSVDSDDPENNRLDLQPDVPIYPNRPAKARIVTRIPKASRLVPTAFKHNARESVKLTMEEETTQYGKLLPLEKFTSQDGSAHDYFLQFPESISTRINERMAEVSGMMLAMVDRDLSWPTESRVLKFDKASAALFFDPMPVCAAGLTHDGLKRSQGVQRSLGTMAHMTAADVARIEEYACHLLNNLAITEVATKAASKLNESKGGEIRHMQREYLDAITVSNNTSRDLAIEMLTWAVYKRRWTLLWAQEQRDGKGRKILDAVRDCTRAYTYNDVLAWLPER